MDIHGLPIGEEVVCCRGEIPLWRVLTSSCALVPSQALLPPPRVVATSIPMPESHAASSQRPYAIMQPN